MPRAHAIPLSLQVRAEKAAYRPWPITFDFSLDFTDKYSLWKDDKTSIPISLPEKAAF
jgi:hypothetical protein